MITYDFLIVAQEDRCRRVDCGCGVRRGAEGPGLPAGDAAIAGHEKSVDLDGLPGNGRKGAGISALL